MSRPQYVLFDVVGTLFSLDRAREAFAARGLPTMAFDLWLHTTLRDGLVLDATDSFAPFAEVAEETLLVLAAEHEWPLERASASGLVRSLATLTPYPDAQMAFTLLARAGIPIAVLTNGGRASTERLLEGAHLDGVRHVFSIDGFRRWKPHRDVYVGATRALGLSPADVALVAESAWDIQGARQAGLMTAWVRRLEVHRHGAMGHADLEGESLVDVAEAIVRLPERSGVGLH